MSAVRLPAKKAMRAATLLSFRAAPHALERLNHVLRRGSIGRHRGVAPTWPARTKNSSRPLVTDVQTAGDADAVVDDEQLAVIARDESHPASEPERVEDREVDARLADASQKRAR